jgi:hypothetical protein
MPAQHRKPEYFSGLDLGQAQDLTSFAVLERTFVSGPTPGSQVTQYAVRHLERFRLGTPFQAIATWLAGRYAKAPLWNTSLVVDLTAVGKPLLGLLRQARLRANLRPIMISSGSQASLDLGIRLVPKRELVSTLQIALQARRLQVAPDLPQAKTLEQELAEFRGKVSTATDGSLEDWRERPHDDLVLAVAIALWEGERCGATRTSTPAVISPGVDCRWAHGPEGW